MLTTKQLVGMWRAARKRARRSRSRADFEKLESLWLEAMARRGHPGLYIPDIYLIRDVNPMNIMVVAQ
jgi:hypothetical protein